MKSKNKNVLILILFSIVFSSKFIIWTFDYKSQKTALIEENYSQKYYINECSPLNELRTSTTLKAKNAYAIVIGISDYPESDDDLSYCDDDASDVYSLLINDYNFIPDNIIYLTDSSATMMQINQSFDDIASRIKEDDIFFFFYSGHGDIGITEGPYSWTVETSHPYSNNYDYTWSVSHPGADYMRVHFTRFECEEDYDYALCGDSTVASNTYYELLTGNLGIDFWSAFIPVDKYYIRFVSDFSDTDWGFEIDKYEVLKDKNTHHLCSYDSLPDDQDKRFSDYMLDSKLDELNCSEKYIVIDSCYSGGMISEVQEIGRYIMTACNENEASYESQSLEHGIFTNYFLKAINNSSDSNGDGVRSMEEYFPYINSNTITASSSLGDTQYPQAYDGISGSAVLEPSFGSVSLSVSGNSMQYSFTLYGTGLIEQVVVVACNAGNSVFYTIEDLLATSTSNTGFEFYTGNIKVDGVTTITSYGIYAKIQGNVLLELNNSIYVNSDLDSLDDNIEILNGLNPVLTDTDADGLNDDVEFYGVTNPLLPDTDFDGLLDGMEVNIYNTDPLSFDTDGDGMDDGYEVANDLNPLYRDGYRDKDQDGLSNLQEYNLGSQANNSDTDGDGMPDGWEYEFHLNLLVDDAQIDPDGDGLINLEEYIHQTDPLDFDTDRDFYSDGIEVLWGTDPLNPFYSLNSIFLNIAGGVVLGLIGYRVYNKEYKKGKRLAKEKVLKEKFAIEKNPVTYNALEIETIEVYKFIEPREEVIWPHMVDASKYLTTKSFQSTLPPLKLESSPEGQKVSLIAQLALNFLLKGNVNDATKYLKKALELGVPEPMNNQIQNYLSVSLNLESYNTELSYRTNDIQKPDVRCSFCGHINKSPGNFCTNCGREI